MITTGLATLLEKTLRSAAAFGVLLLPAIGFGQTILFTEDFENTNLAARAGMTTSIRLSRQSSIFQAVLDRWSTVGRLAAHNPPLAERCGEHFRPPRHCTSATG